MSRYRQPCSHIGRHVNAERDLERHENRARGYRFDSDVARGEADRLAERITGAKRQQRVFVGAGHWDLPTDAQIAEWEVEMQRLDDDAHELLLAALRHEHRADEARALIASLPTDAACLVCVGQGIVVGNGSAHYGGSGHTRASYGYA